MQSIDRQVFDSNATFIEVKDICSLASIRMAADAIEHPQLGSYEYQSKTLGVSLLVKAFNEDHWLFTPEAHDGNIRAKKPDFIIECVSLIHRDLESSYIFPTPIQFESESIHMGIHLIYEAKGKESNDRLEDALAQVVEDQISERANDETNFFVVVQRGLLFAFFEYYHEKSKLDLLNIPHFRGCVPVTAEYENSFGSCELFFPDDYTQPNDLLPLFHNFERLRSQDPEKQRIRQDAANLQVPCVFDFKKHPWEINLVLHRMCKFRPRFI